jgi:hypothetical protein
MQRKLLKKFLQLLLHITTYKDFCKEEIKNFNIPGFKMSISFRHSSLWSLLQLMKIEIRTRLHRFLSKNIWISKNPEKLLVLKKENCIIYKEIIALEDTIYDLYLFMLQKNALLILFLA